MNKSAQNTIGIPKGPATRIIGHNHKNGSREGATTMIINETIEQTDCSRREFFKLGSTAAAFLALSAAGIAATPQTAQAKTLSKKSIKWLQKKNWRTTSMWSFGNGSNEYERAKNKVKFTKKYAKYYKWSHSSKKWKYSFKEKIVKTKKVKGHGYAVYLKGNGYKCLYWPEDGMLNFYNGWTRKSDKYSGGASLTRS